MIHAGKDGSSLDVEQNVVPDGAMASVIVRDREFAHDCVALSLRHAHQGMGRIQFIFFVETHDW